MMEAVWIQILNRSISAGWLILAVILARLLLRKAPKWISVLLWGLVGLRLVMPFTIRAGFSLLPSAEVISPSIGYAKNPTINSGISVFDAAVNPALGTSLAANPGDSVNPMQIWLFVFSIVWIAGIAVLLAYGLFSYLRLRKRVSEAALIQENVWLCDHITEPFILGILRPRIYLPSGLDDREAGYVLAHERAHLKRKDHFWKPVGFLLLSVYWFHPLVWIAYILLCRDIEMACDEKVVSAMEAQDKKAYANALVSCSMQRKLVLACPLAFGEVGVKERIKAVLHYKKPAFWITVVAIIACIVVAVCFLTSPISDEEDLLIHDDTVPEAGATSFDTGEYVGVEWLGHRYVPFCAVSNTDRGTLLTIVNGDEKDQIYEYKGYSPDEWIIRFYHSGLMDTSMLMKEVSVVDIPEELESEYAWNNYDLSSADVFYGSYKFGDLASLMIMPNEEGDYFSFGFDPVSSYLNIGTITAENGRLICKTYDGQFTYVFQIKDAQTLVFDAAHSDSVKLFDPNVGAQIEDGSEFHFSYHLPTAEEVELSMIYNEADYEAAVEKIMDEFNTWDGCEMHSLGRIENDNSVENIAWMNELAKGQGLNITFTQCIGFTSDFHSPVDPALSGAWNPDEEYTGWQWWLARADGGEWRLMTWGFC